jgi:hypothetical protein
VEENSIQITHLRYSFHQSAAFVARPTPFIDVNCTFKVRVTDPPSESLHSELVKGSSDFVKITSVDDPDKFQDWAATQFFKSSQEWENYPGFQEVWTFNEPWLRHLPKFETFQFRDCVADSPSIRHILEDLVLFRETGNLPSVYRNPNDSIVIKHLKTLSTYWD